MKTSRILTLAVMTALLSSPYAWAADKKTSEPVKNTAKAQTETVEEASVDSPLTVDEFTAAKMVSGEKVTLADSYAAMKADENTLLVKNGADVSLSHGALTKAGNTTSAIGSKFLGQNAIVAAVDSLLNLDSCTFTSEGEGANAIFASGAKTEVKLHNANIRTNGTNARGLDATEGAKITADNINIGTKGLRSAAVATEPEGAVIAVTKSTINTAGEASPLLYSKGEINLSEAKGSAGASEIAVVEGPNVIRMEYVDVSGNGNHGIMLYQSKARETKKDSKDKAKEVGRLSVKHSALHSLKQGPMFFINNTAARIYSELNSLQYLGDELIRTVAGSLEDAEENAADLKFMANQQGLHGNVTADANSTISLDLQNGSTWSGAINTSNTAKRVDVTLDASSKWEVTGDSYVNAFTDGDTTLMNIKGNGHTVYYDAMDTANEWLGSKTFALQGGGYLKPVRQ